MVPTARLRSEIGCKRGANFSQRKLSYILKRSTYMFWLKVTMVIGRAIAQAVSRWLPKAAARVRAQVWSNGICGGQSGAGAGFLRVFRGRYNRPVNGRRAEWTQFGLHPPLCELKKN
jgi:hypothetical protein